ncbi:MAG: YtxH domain-containing protein [Bacillota bacterium]
MNRSFFKGLITGGIIGTFISMLNKPQKKPVPETRIVDTSVKVQNSAKKIIKGINKGVSEIMKKH